MSSCHQFHKPTKTHLHKLHGSLIHLNRGNSHGDFSLKHIRSLSILSGSYSKYSINLELTITHLHLKLLSSLNYLNPPSFSPCSKSSCGASKLCQSSHLPFQLTSGLIEPPNKSLGSFLFLKYGKETPFLSFGQPSRPPGLSLPSEVAPAVKKTFFHLSTSSKP